MTFLLVIEVEFVYAFRSFRVCLIKMCALMLDAYMLINVISFRCTSPFISIECPPLSRLINVSLMSSLSKINIGTPACLQEPLSC
jgi:hypothetical protein